MRNLLEIQEQLLPDLMDTLKRRYSILYQIKLSGLVGRRTLASLLSMTERVLRAETDLLKAQGLIEIETLGMRISGLGVSLLEDLEPVMNELFGLVELEEKIRQAYGLRKVVIIPGDSKSPEVKRELGRAGARTLLSFVENGDTIAVTGGSTLAEVAEQMSALPNGESLTNTWFVPARGGLGESMEIQANTIASKMAKRVGAEYRLLHVPDLLSEDAYQSLVQDQHIQEIVDVIRRCRVIIHGIGDAMEMARRRKLDDRSIQGLQADGAIAESFGYYFSEDGEVVHKMLTLGLRLEDIMRTETIIGIAGGQGKGKAIHAVLKFGHEDILVTDEAAALEIEKEIDADI